MNIYDKQLKELNELEKVSVVNTLNVLADSTTVEGDGLYIDYKAKGKEISLPQASTQQTFYADGASSPAAVINKYIALILLNEGAYGASKILFNHPKILCNTLSLEGITITSYNASMWGSFRIVDNTSCTFGITLEKGLDGSKIQDIANVSCMLKLDNTAGGHHIKLGPISFAEATMKELAIMIDKV